jgi:hypothetical protein
MKAFSENFYTRKTTNPTTNRTLVKNKQFTTLVKTSAIKQIKEK